MWPLIIGAVASLASGILQKRSQDKQQQQMMDMIQRMSSKARGQLSPGGWNPIFQALFPGLMTGQGFGTSAGGQLAQQATNLLTNPGQITPIAYERGQANANVMQNALMQALGAGAGSAGIDPASGIQGANVLAGLLGIGAERRNQLNDFTQLSEQLKRSDISLGGQLVDFMTNTGLGVARDRANTYLSQLGGQQDAYGAFMKMGNPMAGAIANVGNMFMNSGIGQSSGGGGMTYGNAYNAALGNLSQIQSMPVHTPSKPFQTNWSALFTTR